MKNNSTLKFLAFIFGLVILGYIYRPTLVHADLPPGIVSPAPACVSNAGSTKCGDNSGKDNVSVYKINCDGSTSHVKTCYKSQDQFCGGNDCQTLTKTETTVSPSNPRLEDPVSVTVSGTGTCSQNINLDPGPGLHDSTDFQNPVCKLTSSVCRDPNIQDQNYRCTWIYSCIGYHLSQNVNNPIDVPTPFETVFTSSNNPSCSSSTQYTVQKALTCNPDNTQDVKDPNGDDSHNLVAPSLNDDKTLAYIQNTLELPPDFTKATLDQISAPLPGIGLQAGFFNLVSLQELVCKNTAVNFILKTVGISVIRLCKVDLNFANSKTEMFGGLAGNIADTMLPSNLLKEPAQNSCYVQDIELQNGGATQGNQIFDKINVSAASHNGYYVSMSPKDVAGYVPDSKSYNISAQHVVVPGDLRSPDINCAEKKWVDEYFPKGIIPPYVDQNAMGCSTTMDVNQPPPGSINACDSKWDLMHNPLGNYGDPGCDFSLEGLASLIKQYEPNPDYFYEYYNVIAACESGYNPDAYNPISTNGTAWGLFQMNGEPPPPLHGYASQYDHGNVAWQNQATNAINHNRTRNNNFNYWQAKKGCPGHTSELFR